MPSLDNARLLQSPTPRGMRWLTAALLASTALAACTADVISGSGGSGTTGDPPEDWSAPGLTDAGVPIICDPGSDSTCYSGPPGTLGAGSCAVGTRACNGDGTAYGACSGDVAASHDACNAPSGLDCQGPATCGITTLWSHGFHGEQAVGTTAVSVDALGNSLIAGLSAGAVDLGTGPLSPGAGGLLFGLLGAFDASGNAIWSRALGTASNTAWSIESMTRDAAGNIYIAGSFGEGGSLDLGAGPMPCHGERDAFVAKLDPVGNLLWSRQLGDEGSELGLTVGVDAAGNVVLSGWYSIAAEDPYAKKDGVGIFVARWSPSGGPLWSKRFGDIFDNGIAAVAPGGEIYLSGPFTRDVDFGGGKLSADIAQHLYLVKLGPAGNHLWSKSLGGKGHLDASAMSVDSQGSVVITGDYEGWANLGGATLDPFSRSQPYLAKFDAQGSHLWSRTLGATTSSGAGIALALAPDGEVTVAGRFSAIDGVDGPYAGSTQMFLSRVSAAGAPLWGKVYSGAKDSGVDVYRIALDGSGDVFATGGYYGVADFGSGALPDTGGWEDIFITRIAP